MFTKPITEEQALDKGIDMFIDIVFYSILIFHKLFIDPFLKLSLFLYFPKISLFSMI